MRQIKYRTFDGTIHNTLAEVEGKRYETIFVDVKESKAEMSAKRKEMINIFRRVSPKFKGCV